MKFIISTNGNNSTRFNSHQLLTKKLLNDLAEIKHISKADLKHWLSEDYTSFSTLSVSAKHIQSTNRLSVTLTKNSAQSFYVGSKSNQAKRYCQCLTQHQIKTNPNGTYSFCSVNCSLKTWLSPPDNCLTDAQSCAYFNLFNSKEKKLYTKFLDKVEANFEGQQWLEPNDSPPISDHNPENPKDQTKTPPQPTEPGYDKPKQHLNSILKNPPQRLLDTRPYLFLTLTFNTSQKDYHAWTTNWNASDPCWDRLKETYLKPWANSFDPRAEPSKTHIPKLETDVSQYPTALRYLQLFLRRVRRLWKPQNWKWVVVAELQKKKANNPGNWHFHLLSTPIVPYSHKCVLDKNFAPCWNCCAYIAKLWPYGRADLRSPGDKPISQYLAKYLSKSFHLRKLYQDHGLKEHSKTYRFFMNSYQYDQREALLIGKSKLDAETKQYLAKNQTVFRNYDYKTEQTSYFYRTSEKLIGKVQKPYQIKKNYRLATRTLNPLKLLKLASKSKQSQAILFKKPPKLKPTSHDFQEFLITNLLTFCKSAEFINLPLEQDQVPKLQSTCDQTVYHHFKAKPILHFKFAVETVPLVLGFLNNLDDYAQEYDTEESSNFLDSRFTDPIESRNAYLNQWQINTHHYRQENAIYRLGRTPG